MKTRNRVIVALNVNSVDEAISLVEKLSPHVGGFKVGFELMSAMLASAIMPDKDGLSVRKIHKLFNLLGHSIFKVLWLVESKADGNGCVGVIFIPFTTILVDKKGAQISAMTTVGDMIEGNIIGDFVEFGDKITKASDPVKATKEAAEEAESLTEELGRYIS